MGKVYPIPNAERVRDAVSRFNKENEVIEGALEELFGRYKLNTNHSHVLLKVVTLNRLYSAGVLAVEALAAEIYKHGEAIDSALASGDGSAVEMIAKITIDKKELRFFSFATKYCSWHNQEAYAVYDSRVDRYLWSLQRYKPFSDFKDESELRRDYATFFKIMCDFKKYYGLEDFSFKDIDKFLWSQEPLDAASLKGN